MGSLRSGFVAVAVWALTAPPALAQPAQPIVTPDISASLGWLNTNYSDLGPYDDWSNDGVHGAVAFGWSWTPHIRTELEASASSRVRHFSSAPITIDRLPGYIAVENTFSTRRLTLGGQYQFRENAWFHPQVSAGVDFNWESRRTVHLETSVYDPVTRQSRVVRPAVRETDRTVLHTRPFVGAGFKAYMTPRAFFRSDVRVVAGDRVEDVLLRFGFGVDLPLKK